MKLILNNNIYVVLQEFQEAIHNGYRFTPKSDLFTSVSGLHELQLFKQDVEVNVLSHEDAIEKVLIDNHDKNKFLCSLQQHILSGYAIDFDSLYWDSYGGKRVVVVNPEHPNNVRYTKEDLYELPYDEIKIIGRLRGCFNRNKDVMIAGILKYEQEKTK
jgi:hypothetical protein